LIVTAGYLLDTNVISETRKARADTGEMAFLSAADAERLFLSVLTLGELRKGVEAKRRTDPVGADLLGAWVDSIETTFSDRMLPVGAAAATRWGELSAGRSLPVIDTLIAATAISHDLTLVTRNTRDVESTSVPLIDPWQDR
jgi:predicted nucleic acid-binding protein